MAEGSASPAAHNSVIDRNTGSRDLVRVCVGRAIGGVADVAARKGIYSCRVVLKGNPVVRDGNFVVFVKIAAGRSKESAEYAAAGTGINGFGVAVAGGRVVAVFPCGRNLYAVEVFVMVAVSIIGAVVAVV